MARQREATTDRLVGIIASIQLGRKSGQLRVRRGEGLTSEDGILTFIQGQMTQARVGRRNGASALNWLCTWGQARYVFTPPDDDFTPPDDDEEPTQHIAVLPTSLSGRTATNPGPRATLVHTNRGETEPPLATNQEVPRTCVDLHEATVRIEYSKLSRSHWHLYLLIDGHRSVHDLEPLMRRKAKEVHSMLHDLERLGIIQFTAPSSKG